MFTRVLIGFSILPIVVWCSGFMSLVAADGRTTPGDEVINLVCVQERGKGLQMVDHCNGEAGQQYINCPSHEYKEHFCDMSRRIVKYWFISIHEHFFKGYSIFQLIDKQVEPKLRR